MTEQTNQTTAPHLAHAERIALLWGLGASLFWVIALWGFFGRDVYALGINAATWYMAMLLLFLWVMRREGPSLRANLAWIAPFFLIAFSYALYDNPFLKVVNMLVLPSAFALFYNDAFLSVNGRVRWSAKVCEGLIWRVLSIVTHIRKAFGQIERLATQTRKEANTAKRVAIGVGLFLLIAVAVIIPLLSSADAQFAAHMKFVNDWMTRLLDTSLFGRMLIFLLLSVGTTAALLAWARPFPHADAEEETKQADSIVAGIVIGGMLALYALFLWIQLGRMWVGALPVTFSETERLVKDGFWQLLSLTVINILFTTATYKKTVHSVQRLLIAFAAASLLLLASAGHRMLLYVVNYGLSYEKFFATYAVLFCAILLLWLVVRLCMRGRADIMRFPMMLFLWMYAVLTIMPVEQIVMRSNVALSHRPSSQIRLFELTMLSPDVLGLVKQYQKEGVLDEKTSRYSREAMAMVPYGAATETAFDWNPWIENRSRIVADKAWYELTLSNLLSR